MRIIKYFARAPWSSSDKLARHEPRLRLRLRQSRTRRRGRTRGSGKMASFRLWSQPLRPPDSWKQIVSLVTKNYSLWPPKKYKLSSQKVSQPNVFFQTFVGNLCFVHWQFSRLTRILRREERRETDDNLKQSIRYAGACILDRVTVTERCHQHGEDEESGNSARCPESALSEVLHSNYIIPGPSVTL